MSTTKTLSFAGHSDDTFGYYVDGSPAEDHDDAGTGKVRTYHVRSRSTGDSACVIGVYGAGCNWAIGIGVDNDENPLPGWAQHPMFSTDGYTPVMEIVVPVDATVTLVHPRKSQ